MSAWDLLTRRGLWKLFPLMANLSRLHNLIFRIVFQVGSCLIYLWSVSLFSCQTQVKRLCLIFMLEKGKLHLFFFERVLILTRYLDSWLDFELLQVIVWIDRSSLFNWRLSMRFTDNRFKLLSFSFDDLFWFSYHLLHNSWLGSNNMHIFFRQYFINRKCFTKSRKTHLL